MSGPDDTLKGHDPLTVSYRVQAEASALGFDWPDVQGVIAKIYEELGEFEEALNIGDSAHAQQELGDVLMATVNLARFLNTTPGEQLARATDRFQDRFGRLKTEVQRRGLAMDTCSLEELDELWDEVKRAIRRDREERLT